MSVTVKQLIEDAVTKAFVTVNNVFQPKITELEDRYSTGGFYMLGDGSAYTVSDPTNPEQKRLRRQAAFLYAFNRGEYIGGRQYAMRNNTVDGKSMVTLNATIVMNDSYLSGESYDLFIIDRSSYDDSTDTVTTRATFIATQINGMRTYRGVYNGSKVGNANASGTCTLDELAPTTFSTTTDRISFKGTGSTGVTKEIIRFIDNTNDDNGYGIAIGGGGPTFIGGGESVPYILNNPSTTIGHADGAENMVIANDNGIIFLTGLDSGYTTMKKTIIDTNGNLLVNSGGGVYVGSNKTAQYTYPGVMLHPEGYICLTNSTSVSSRGGIYFAYNNSASATAYVKETSSGSLELGPNCLTLHCVHNSGVTGYSLASDAANGKRMSFLSCNTSTQLALYGQWGSTSSYGYRYVAVTTSDPRLKENIIKSNINALSIINKIPMYSFNWKSDNKHWDVGYIATEMFDIDSNLVMIPDSEDDKDKYWSINDFYISGLQTKAIQELSAENKQLKAEIKELKNTLNSINERLKKLEV